MAGNCLFFGDGVLEGELAISREGDDGVLEGELAISREGDELSNTQIFSLSNRDKFLMKHTRTQSSSTKNKLLVTSFYHKH
jgi:hypothetical protein